jgi:hypothetical protein
MKMILVCLIEFSFDILRIVFLLEQSNHADDNGVQGNGKISKKNQLDVIL